MQAETNTITLRLACRNLPADYGLRLGIQKDKNVIEDVDPDTGHADFLVPLGVRFGTDDIDFSGPFVQGKRGDRFVYLVWGTRADGDGAWTTARRAKLPLRHLTRARTGTVQRTGGPICIEIDMTDRRGEPLCATIPEHHLTVM